MAGVLLCLCSAPLRAEEGPEQPEKEEEQAADQAESERHDSEAQAQTQKERQDQVQEIEKGAKTPWVDKWAKFRQSTRDVTNWDFKEGMFRLRFGIRLEIDLTGGDSSPAIETAVGPIDESVNFRRARVFADGDIARRFHFRYEYDFGANRGQKDAYIDNVFREKLKVVAVRMGHFKEPFSLERQTSDNFGGFLERALAVDTFTPGRNLGIAAYGNHREARLAWTFGSFTHGQTNPDNPGTSDLTLTGRITGLPSYRDEGKHLVHLGMSASLRSPKGNAVDYATRPEARFAPFFLDTGDISADRNTLLGLEFATVQGPTWVQAELIGAQPDIDEAGRTTLGGAYAEAGWFLTGEHRPYQRFDGTFGRLAPLRPYKLGGNPFQKDSPGGAIEITGRASWIDLNDGPVQAGRMFDVTLGMNWYMTRNQRCLFNYVRSDVEGVGHANIFLIRYQLNPGYHWPPLDPRWRDKNAPTDAQSRE